MTLTPAQMEERLSQISSEYAGRITEIVSISTEAFTDYCNKVADKVGFPLDNAQIRRLLVLYATKDTRSVTFGAVAVTQL